MLALPARRPLYYAADVNDAGDPIDGRCRYRATGCNAVGTGVAGGLVGATLAKRLPGQGTLATVFAILIFTIVDYML